MPPKKQNKVDRNPYVRNIEYAHINEVVYELLEEKDYDLSQPETMLPFTELIAREISKKYPRYEEVLKPKVQTNHPLFKALRTHLKNTFVENKKSSLKSSPR